MFEFILALLTGWLAFETTAPTTDSFGSFLLFFVVWIVYFIIGQVIYKILFKSSSTPKEPSKLKVNLSDSPAKIVESLFGNIPHSYYSNRMRYCNNEIKKNLFSVALHNQNIDFSHLWMLFEDDYGKITFDLSSDYIDQQLRSNIELIIFTTITEYEKNYPLKENYPE